MDSLIKIIDVDFKHSDERGSLIQLIHEGYKQVNVIATKSGAFRGGHFHKKNDEAFFIISGKVVFSAELDGVVETKEFSAGSFFGIGPNVVHGFTFLEDTLLVSLYSIGVEHADGTKDIYNSNSNR